jgi:hypothetical protein
MTQILARLSAINFLTLLAAFAVGLVSWLQGGRHNPNVPTYLLHFYLGLFAILLNLGVHCLVFIYFLGTGRWVKEVAEAYQLPDIPLPKLTRELKRWTFPVALLAMLVPITVAVAGEGVRSSGWPWYFHFSLALVTLLVCTWAFVIEYRNVSINAVVISDVMKEVDRIRVERGLPTNEEALRQEEERDRQETEAARRSS